MSEYIFLPNRTVIEVENTDSSTSFNVTANEKNILFNEQEDVIYFSIDDEPGYILEVDGQDIN